MLADSLGMNINLNITGKSILIATFMGLTIPLISSVLPISNSLGRSIVSALDNTRSP
eukprot:UN14242